MIQLLRNLVLRLRADFPVASETLELFVRRFFGRWIGTYPRVLGNEIGAVKRVLLSSKWNMAYGSGLVHERLEAAFCSYVGVSNAIAVNTGGMALQMSLRALGLKRGDEVVLQVDTCSATAFAILNAGATPVFSDVSQETFMLNTSGAGGGLSLDTKAVIATHMWGNPEDLNAVEAICRARGVPLIEDSCLALGSMCGSKMAGGHGKVGVFSFGCLKPIQGGEGGMLVTEDGALARELRSLRHWGDRTIDYGVRDTTQLAWNGRMSELVAAVVTEQLKGFPDHLSALRGRVAEFEMFLNGIDGMNVHLGAATRLSDCSFTQVVVRIDPQRLKMASIELRRRLQQQGIATWYPNFEQIPGLSFFAKDNWREWVREGRVDDIQANYHARFPGADLVGGDIGLGFPQHHFTSRARLKNLIRGLRAALAE